MRFKLKRKEEFITESKAYQLSWWPGVNVGTLTLTNKRLMFANQAASLESRKGIVAISRDQITSVKKALLGFNIDLENGQSYNFVVGKKGQWIHLLQ